MPKLTGPLFSVEARKALGKALAYQRRPSGASVYGYKKPKVPFTWKQKSQRWLVWYAVASWQLQSDAVKAEFEARAKGQGQSGYSLWMHERTALGSDVVLYLLGAEGGSGIIHDLSRYGNHGTIDGATWTKLPSGLWYLDFDGTDDYVYGDVSLVNPLDAFTIEAWIRNDIGLPYPIFMEGRAAQNYAFFDFYITSLRIGLSARNDANTLLDVFSNNGVGGAAPPFTFSYDRTFEDAIDVDPESGGNHAEGITSDGTYLYVSDRYNIWQLTQEGVKTGVSNTHANTDGTDCEQINGIWRQGNYLYVGASNKNGVGTYIKVFNKSDLTYVEEHQVADHPGANGENWGTEGCAFYKGYWWLSYYKWTGIAKYDTNWAHVADYMTDSFSQGLFVLGDYLVVIQAPEGGVCQAWFYRWEDPNLVFHGKTAIPNAVAANDGAVQLEGRVVWWADNPASNADGDIIKTTLVTDWHKVGVTCDGAGTYKFYIDGVEYSADVNTMTGSFNTLEHFALGALWRAAVANFFGGGIALPRSYNRDSSALEVQNRYQQERHLFRV